MTHKQAPRLENQADLVVADGAPEIYVLLLVDSHEKLERRCLQYPFFCNKNPAMCALAVCLRGPRRGGQYYVTSFSTTTPPRQVRPSEG
jgi:hypothetical protein